MKRWNALFGVLLFGFVSLAAPAQADEAKKPFSYKFKIGAQTFLKADLEGDALDGDDDAQFGVQRVSLYAMGSVYDFAHLKVHLLSMPATGNLAPALADVHMTFTIHELFNVKLGRFKKHVTRVYTPFWGTWRFFDVPKAFQYLKGNLGLGGRGEGAIVFGGVGKRLLKYSLGIFNGLEEQKATATMSRTDEGLQLVARVDWQPVEMFKMGLGATYLYDTFFNNLTAGTSQKMDLLSYAADVNFFWKGLTVAGEFIGHATMPDAGDTVLGGGLYADVLYAIPLPLGEIEPGLRYARHYADFDDTDTYSEAITGALQWHLGRPGLRVGLEVSWMNNATSAADSDSILGLVQVQLVR